jgi:hypothetical protein
VRLLLVTMLLVLLLLLAVLLLLLLLLVAGVRQNIRKTKRTSRDRAIPRLIRRGIQTRPRINCHHSRR